MGCVLAAGTYGFFLFSSQTGDVCKRTGQHNGRGGERLRVDVASVCNFKFRVSSAVIARIVSIAISPRANYRRRNRTTQSIGPGSANSNN